MGCLDHEVTSSIQNCFKLILKFTFKQLEKANVIFSQSYQ